MRTNKILVPPRLRSLLFWTHLAVGCLAGVVILIMSITGILLAYQRQILAYSDRSHPTPSAATAASLPIETLMAAVSAQQHAAPSAVTLHSDPAAPAEVSFGREHVLLVDTRTGAVLGESSPALRSFFRSVEDWHRWLGASTEHRPTWRALTGAGNFAFLMLALSGPFLWLPRRWSWNNVKAVATFRRGLMGRARDFNWHNTIGIWCVIPLIAITLSGVVMSYPWANDLLYRVTGNEPQAQGGGRGGPEAGRGQNAAAGRKNEPGFAGWNELWAAATKQVPGWTAISLRSTVGRGPLTFTIDTGDGGRPDQRAQLTLNRRTAEVVRMEPFSSYNSGRRLRSWFRFLHTGEAGGILGETIAAIASAGGAMLVWTGLFLAVRRLLRSLKRARTESQPVVRKEPVAAAR